jgi:DNA mismatch repair protein MutL
MEDIVKLLPDSVANQIAAGEVIQRPASVIKELVENAVDAGATIIRINIKDAGRTLIQVIDNGCGMSPMDARMAFERHATSKIGQATDLFSLHTMGFRGEALASICAIAEVELKTMRRGDQMGTRIVITGSKVETQEPTVTAPGSIMTVKKLFFNVPARRKFLKSDHVEMSNILHEFERLALVNPNVEFELTHNEVVVHQLLKSTFKQRIIDLFGKALDKQLVPIVSDTSLVKITGFVSRPENARRRGALQYFMVNGRNMRHPYFHKAVMQCYEQLIPADEQPQYFINFEVDPETIDVNIHPTKNEIKFENEQPIWQILTATIREGLGKFNAVPSIDFDQTNAPDIPVFDPNANGAHGLDLDPTYNPFATSASSGNPFAGAAYQSEADLPATPSAGFNETSGTGGGAYRPERHASTRNWEKLYEDFAGAPGIESSFNATSTPSAEQPGTLHASSFNDLAASLPPIEQGGKVASMFNSMNLDSQSDQTEPTPTAAIQIKGRYIITPSHDGLLIIDQHRAHIRILYDRYIELANMHAFTPQRVMFPEAIDLSASDSTILEEISGEMEKLGFEISFLGNSSWSVNSLPSVLGNVNPRTVIEQLIDTAAQTGNDLGSDIRNKIALSMARSAAVRPGQTLTSSEIDHLLSDLFKLTSPGYTPDGKTVMAVLTTDDIAALL